MMLPLCQHLPALLSITKNNDREGVFTHTETEMGISFLWQTSVIYRTKHCCRKFSQNKFSICLNNKKGQQTTVHALRYGNRWLHLMHFHLSAWHRVFTKAAFTHMAAICKDVSNQFEMQTSFCTQFITERGCSEAERVLQQLTNQIQTA